MFESIGSFFKKIMKPDQKELLVEATSKDAAKERLHIVLMQDRANVSADFLELMKQEIIDVIKKYIVVDEEQIDVRLTNQENDDGTAGAPALYANIPILNIRNDIKSEVLSGSPITIENLDVNSENQEIVGEILSSDNKSATETIETKETDNYTEQNENVEQSVQKSASLNSDENIKEDESKEDTTIYNKKIEEDEIDDDVTFDDLLKVAEEEERQKNIAKTSPKKKSASRGRPKKKSSGSKSANSSQKTNSKK